MKKRISRIRFLARRPALALLLMGFMLGASPPFLHASTGEDQAALQLERLAHEAMAQDPPDWEAARGLFTQAAESGSDRAMSYLGWMYEEGHGVTADGAMAAYWYGRAADAGAHEFAVKLGWMHLAGDGVPRDRDLAEHWFRQAIEADYPPARIALSSMLIADAQGGRDPERIMEARALLEEALAQEQSLAAFFLARLYLEGIAGHPVDEERAAHYTLIGAEAGHAQLQGWLALMYRTGRGLERDDVEAMSWAILAAGQGDSFGEQLRVFMEAELSPEEQAQAHRRAMLRLSGQP